jgi:hypothetical protein
LLQVIRSELTPEARFKPDVGEITVVAQEPTSVKLLERHLQHQPLSRTVIEFIHGLLAGSRFFHNKTGGAAIPIEPAKALCYLAEPGSARLIPLKDQLQRDFYAEMCRGER